MEGLSNGDLIYIAETELENPEKATTCLHCKECIYNGYEGNDKAHLFECLKLRFCFYIDDIPNKPCI